MKRVIFTQRVEIINSYNERRDCADQEIGKLIWECGYIPIPINNNPANLEALICELSPNGIIFSGGNDLFKYGGNAPERDETEYFLIKYAVENNIPVYGFCRGMQIIADYFGFDLFHVENHAGTKHKLIGNNIFSGREVNSYHNYAVEKVEEPFVVLAKSQDGVIEAIRHEDKNIYAAMWHHEREKPYKNEDINFIKSIFM